MLPPETPSAPHKWGSFLLKAAALLAAVAIGYFGRALFTQPTEAFPLLQQAQKILLENTILDVPEDPALEYGMIQGMLGTLNDPYTYFVEPAAHEVESDQLEGAFGGIGARLDQDTDRQWRLYPLPDSPALAAGIRDGDILTQVDDLPITAEIDQVTLLAAIRGPEGQVVELRVLRGAEAFAFIIRRQAVPIPSVTYNLLPEAPAVGILHMTLIADTTADELSRAMEDLQAQGATAFILDLRNNGGGLVEAAVETARLFLADGEVLHQQFRDQPKEVFTVKKPGPYATVPLVVLVNENTASSAEIVAGALLAQDRATVIGAPTYGKTVIQYIFDLEDGSSVHVTSGRWWIPGVEFPLAPDITVTDDQNGTVILQSAINALTN